MTAFSAIRALEHAVGGLGEQLTKAEQRAALAERDAVALRGELGGLLISERVAVAEVAVLHQQLEVAERQAGAAAHRAICARKRTTLPRPSGSPATRPPGCAPSWPTARTAAWGGG